MTIHARFLPKYPKRIDVTDGLTKREANGVLTLGFDYVNSEFGAELQQAVDSTAADAVSTAADRSAAEAAKTAAEAARDVAVSITATFSLYTDLAGYHPNTAPDRIETRGYATIGVGAGLYAKNGTTSGDVVITLSDGTTEAGYTLTRDRAYNPQQTAVIGYVDDRTAFQEMFDKLQDGDTLEFPGWAKAKIVNGVGTGADAWAQRADAVANGGLRAVTCSKDNITLINNGQITITSPLDDGIRMTGKGVLIKGAGLTEYTGSTFIDTNAQNDDTLQWLPSLVYLSGLGSGVEGESKLRFRRPPSVAIRLGGYRAFANKCRIFGGPTTYQPNGNNGTVLFGVYSGTPTTSPTDQRVEGNWFYPDTDGGKLYSDVFNTARDAIIKGNNHKGAWEHAIYSYGIRALIQANMISNMVAGAIQCFNEGAAVKDNEIEFCNGGIQFMRANYINATGNKITRTTGSGIALRSFPGEANNLLYGDIEICGNIIALAQTGGVYTGSPIDVDLDNPYDGLLICNNDLLGAATSSPSLNAGIRCQVSATSAAVGVGAVINGNTIKNCDGLAVDIRRAQDFSIRQNRIPLPNGASGSIAILGYNCVNGDVDSNVVTDRRGTKKTSVVADFSDATNSAIRGRDNNLVGGLPSAALPFKPPSDSSSWGRGNTFDGLPSEGEFTTVANTSFSVGGSGATVANSVAAAVRAGAKVRIFPVSDSA